MDGPLTYEQLFGVPEEQAKDEAAAADGLCPYEKIRCAAWDGKQGCQADFCVMKAAGAQAAMQANLEAE